jgi:hypothetical protein
MRTDVHGQAKTRIYENFRSEHDKSSCVYRESNPGLSARILIFYTELTRLFITNVCLNILQRTNG